MQDHLKIIYCRGNDPKAPQLAIDCGWEYGVRYDCTAYDDVYFLDCGLKTRWISYMRKVHFLKPKFALIPDYRKPDKITLGLYWQDLAPLVQRVGVCPKFVGAVAQLPEDAIICESVPTDYAGFLIPDDELLPEREYHLLGGDPRLQLSEIQRIHNAGGRVISVDGNKLMMKAAHGQVFRNGQWVQATGETNKLAVISAHEIKNYLVV